MAQSVPSVLCRASAWIFHKLAFIAFRNKPHKAEISTFVRPFGLIQYIMVTTEQLYSLFKQHSVCTTDTRDCTPGSIFFALRGTTFNGNDFALKALEAGCAYAVVDDPSLPADERLLQVPDVLLALQQLAAYHRKMWGGPVVQITGTNGKTTTKELTAAVLQRKFNVLFTQGNFNNHIGVPKTLLRLTREHQIAVIETGANHPGEIATLSHIVQPDCGLITNVGSAHLEGFGSFEGVLHTKGELYEQLRSQANGFVFLHADNEHLVSIVGTLPTVTYGAPGQGYDVEGEVLQAAPFLAFRFRVRGGAWQTVRTQLIGDYNLPNALAAVAVGTHWGVSPEDAAQALADYRPTNNRSQWLRTERNELIVDAYNANPTSMRAALQNFAAIDHPHKLLILGEMRELGDASQEEHKLIAELARKTQPEEVWFVGREFEPFADGSRWFPDVEAVKEALQEKPLKDRLVLVKGSNGTRLYQLPEFL